MQVALKYGHQVLSFDGISINARCLDLLLHFEKRSAVKISNAKLVCNGRFLNIRQTAAEVCCVVCGNRILLENSLFFFVNRQACSKIARWKFSYASLEVRAFLEERR